MRTINFDENGNSNIAPPQEIHIENNPLPPIENNNYVTTEPKSNKHVLLYLLAIPLIVGALLLGNFLLNKSNSFFMNKRDKMVQEQIDEHTKKKDEKEEQIEQKPTVYARINYPEETFGDKRIAIAISTANPEIFIENIEEYGLMNYELKYHDYKIMIDTSSPFRVTENDEDLSKELFNINRIEKIDDHFYIINWGDEKEEYIIFYKLYEKKKDNNSEWYGIIIANLDFYYSTWTKNDAKKILKLMKDDFKILIYTEDLKNVRDENNKNIDISSYTNINSLIIKKIEEAGLILKKESDVRDYSIYSTLDGPVYVVEFDDDYESKTYQIEKVKSENISYDNKKFTINDNEAIVTLNEESNIVYNYDIYIHKDNNIYRICQAGPSADEAINMLKHYFEK